MTNTPIPDRNRAETARPHLDTQPGVPSTNADRSGTVAYLISLANQVLESWSRTAKVAALAGVLAGIIVCALWLLPLGIDIGPVHIYHEHSSSGRQQSSDMKWLLGRRRPAEKPSPMNLAVSSLLCEGGSRWRAMSRASMIVPTRVPALVTLMAVVIVVVRWESWTLTPLATTSAFNSRNLPVTIRGENGAR